jgi:hypothetical protein
MSVQQRHRLVCAIVTSRKKKALPHQRYALIAARGLAVLVGILGVALAIRYPLGSVWGIIGFGASLLLVYYARDLWLVIVPVLVVVGDLYPWTGSLLVNESDFFLLATLTIFLWQDASLTTFLPKRQWLLWLPLAISVSVSFVNGWQQLPLTLPGDELSLYAGQWNSVRVAKGFVWGLILAQLVGNELGRGSDRLRILLIGIQLSALVVAITVMFERTLAVGLLDFQQLYRATGLFFSMHTGGQHIDAFWALALPFLYLPLARRETWLVWLIRIVLLIFSFYAIVATMSRAVIVWAALITLTLVLFPIIWRDSRERRCSFAIVAVTMILCVGILILRSAPIRERFADSGRDLLTRWQQWKALCDAAKHDGTSIAIGNGMGLTPTIASTAYDQPIRASELVSLDGGDVALRIYPGKEVYIEQLVDSGAPGPWTLTGRVRRQGTANLQVHVCQKMLFDSFQCTERRFAESLIPGAWLPLTWSIDVRWLSDNVGQSRYCPVTLAFSASGDDGAVELSDLRLTDAHESSLLTNANFRDGSSRWFFTSDDHSAWRAENLWVHLYLEQGLLGVVCFAWLVFGTLALLIRQAAVNRDVTLCIPAASILGFLAMGAFGSLLDTPWITQLLCVLLAAGQSMVRQEGPTTTAQSPMVDFLQTNVFRNAHRV